MDSLRTLAMIYETGKEAVLKSVLDKLMFENHIFVFIGIDPRQESTYTYTNGEISKVLKLKLDAAEELYIINPKGAISRHLHYFLGYGEETGKPIRYMYKFCYTDCRHRKGKACSLPMDVYFIPDKHKLLPACESYVRIYDDFMVNTKGTPEEDAPAIPQAVEKAEETVSVESVPEKETVNS